MPVLSIFMEWPPGPLSFFRSLPPEDFSRIPPPPEGASVFYDMRPTRRKRVFATVAMAAGKVERTLGEPAIEVVAKATRRRFTVDSKRSLSERPAGVRLRRSAYPATQFELGGSVPSRASRNGSVRPARSGRGREALNAARRRHNTRGGYAPCPNR